jgi:hypothetical protein
MVQHIFLNEGCRDRSYLIKSESLFDNLNFIDPYTFSRGNKFPPPETQNEFSNMKTVYGVVLNSISKFLALEQSLNF